MDYTIKYNPDRASTSFEFFDIDNLRAALLLTQVMFIAHNEKDMFKVMAKASKLAKTTNELALIVHHCTTFITQQNYTKVILDTSKTNNMSMLGITMERAEALMKICIRKQDQLKCNSYLETIAAVDQSGAVTKNELIFITINASVEYALTHPDTIKFVPNKK